ncbi:hypothetical protein CI109_101468 [Kwoniella shandongensis]|uniref:Uncharacterized protein n=1 Tax=Kwoniella shandongensis TaxID=1734106 RepID=A0A5M6C3J2_9TREE|nr:uncharacterized protein CI109_001938 [Kwoniella shandongensis]KAA5529513.1 hypothetical protein CI109_001938 [Kwoniella shandongensis]
MSFLGLNLANNLSFYSIPVAWVLALAPHAYAMSLYNAEKANGTPDWDICMPRKNISHVKESKMSPAAQDMYLRAESAQENGFANIPLYAAAILAGNFARLSPSTLNTAAGIYLLSRVAYNLVYINNTSVFWGNVRTGVFLTGIFTCFTLFVKAGNVLV